MRQPFALQDAFDCSDTCDLTIKDHRTELLKETDTRMKRYYHLIKTFKNWWLYPAYKYGFVHEEPLVFDTRSGVHVEVPLRLLHTFKEIFMDECYLAGLENEIPANATVIDIGANAGYFSLFAAASSPGAKVYAFEPVPVNYAQLKRHCDLNKPKTLHCFQQAVAGHCGEITLTFDPLDSFTTSATILDSPKATDRSFAVPCVTLQDLMDLHNIRRCDLLKMDCEGAEYEIFYNCPPDVLKRIDQIAMEVHGGREKNQNIDALESFLIGQGFATRRRPVGMLWAWRR